MSILEWQQLSPADAAATLHRRVRSLSSAQQRAVVAGLLDETKLAARLERAADGPLRGVPVLVKDLFDLAGFPTFAGSTFLPEVRPTPDRDGAFVAHVHATGAACVGKTHLHEFAYGITGENSHYGDCEHPRFPGRISGGSSSGSAAAVAAGIVPLALGSDTGGSVRVPSAFCGVFGFRLQPHDAWIADGVPLSPTCDTAGWFTGTGADMKRVHAALIGASTTMERAPRGVFLPGENVDADVAAVCRAAAERLGCVDDAECVSELVQGFSTAPTTYSTIVASEGWTYHAPWFDTYASRYDPNVRIRLEQARQLSPEVIAAARTQQRAIREVWAAFFRTYDFLAMPATPAGAFTKAECTLANRQRLLALGSPASVGGLPVLTIPLALPSGLTTGLQIIVRTPDSPVVQWALDQGV